MPAPGAARALRVWLVTGCALLGGAPAARGAQESRAPEASLLVAREVVGGGIVAQATVREVHLARTTCVGLAGRAPINDFVFPAADGLRPARRTASRR